MMIRKLSAELLGTFLLALLVRLSIGAGFPVPTAVVAGLTLGLVVYMLGGVSGAHINPAVTIALAAVKKISPRDAGLYILAQLAGGYLALLVADALTGAAITIAVANTMTIAVGEAIGAGILVLGVSSVLHGKTPSDASGLAIGTALTLGALAASSVGNGIVNPAVALGLGSLSLAYVFGPVVGGIVAALLYKAVVKAK